jgi:DNA polymerase/3'-5' exonuclease PolX
VRETNRWAVAARVKKAGALATELLTAGILPDAALAMGEADRLAVAALAGVHAPSDLCWRLAVSALPGGPARPVGYTDLKIKVRRPREMVAATVESITRDLHAEGIEHVWCGSWRRGEELVGDLDLLVVTDDELYMVALPDDIASPTAAYQSSTTTSRCGDTPVQVDVWASPEDTVGAHLWHLTGPAKLNIAMRQHAAAMGLGTLSQHGLITADGSRLDEPGRGERPIADILGIDFIPPTRRSTSAIGLRTRVAA